MNPKHITKITGELSLTKDRVKAVAELLEEGSTIPFIARYRKEATGSLDETVITNIRNRLYSLKELDERRETILNSLEKNGHLTDELREAVENAETMSQLEDILQLEAAKGEMSNKEIANNALFVLENSGIVKNPKELIKDGWNKKFIIKPTKEGFDIYSKNYETYLKKTKKNANDEILERYEEEE